LSSSIPRYYLLHYLYYRFAYETIIDKGYDPASEDVASMDYTPLSPEVYPLLKFINFSDPRVHLIIGAAVFLG
jgi:hypothetical protein